MKQSVQPEKIGSVVLDFFGTVPEEVYCEGTDVEERVLQIFKAGEDPIEVLKQDNRWPLLYQLSASRGNITLPMQLDKDKTVLDLGSGMGAITAAIASRCGRVDCVDISLARCRANAYRNRDAKNVRIHVGNIMQYESEEQYDIILLIGVLEYAAVFCDEENPFDKILQLCKKWLKPNGILYIAIENRIGIKYMAGCNEDHLGRPFVGVEGYHCQEKMRTFSRSELLEIVERAGFVSSFFYYPLPDYKLPIVIYSDDYLPGNELNLPFPTNYDADRYFCFNDVLTLKSLRSSDEFKMLANSFLLEVRKEDK